MKRFLYSPLIAIALLIAGCGDTFIDPRAAEEDILRELLDERGIEVDAVRCPEEVEAENGDTYECTAQTPRAEFRITYRQIDDEGGVGTPEIERIGPARG